MRIIKLCDWDKERANAITKVALIDLLDAELPQTLSAKKAVSVKHNNMKHIKRSSPCNCFHNSVIFLKLICVLNALLEGIEKQMNGGKNKILKYQIKLDTVLTYHISEF